MLKHIKKFLTFLILGIGIMLFSNPAQAQGLFIRGDVNCDGVVDTMDFRLLVNNYVLCKDKADVDDNGTWNRLADSTYLANYLFFGGPPPPHPFPDCGIDTTVDSINCTVSCCCTLVTACNDGLDNDGDGLIDYPEDPSCANACDDNEAYTQCDDGLDNDGDGLRDYLQDCGCDNAHDSTEAPNSVRQCSDGIDNDGDGKIDLADPECDNHCDTLEFFELCISRPCDVDGNGTWTLTDVIGLVGTVFKGKPKPTPLCQTDCNASGGNPTLSDIVYLVNKVFKSGPNPLPAGVCCLP